MSLHISFTETANSNLWEFLHALPSLIWLAGSIIIICILDKRFYLRIIRLDYLIKKIRFKTKSIIIGDYWSGFNEKYKKYTRIFMVLTNDKIIITPFYSLRKSFIQYEKINSFDIVLTEPYKGYIVELDENKFPVNIRDLEFIEIKYITDNGKEDTVVLRTRDWERYYKFNRYAYSKCNYFEKIKSQIGEKVIQSTKTYERKFYSNPY